MDGWGKVEKGNVEEVAEGKWRLRKGICCWLKSSRFRNLTFSATKQDTVGPSLQLRNTLFTTHTVRSPIQGDHLFQT